MHLPVEDRELFPDRTLPTGHVGRPRSARSVLQHWNEEEETPPN